MGVVMFYHLTRSSLHETLAPILARAIANDWRVMVRVSNQSTAAALDHALWLGSSDRFLPHGVQGGPHDADQPVLLGTGAISNGAQGLMLLESATTTPEEAMPLDRVWVLFDGADPAALAIARALWTQLTSAGLSAQYWSEESGRWEMKLEKKAGV